MTRFILTHRDRPVKQCFSAKRVLGELVWRVSDGEQIPSSPVRLHLSHPFGAEELFVNPEVIPLERKLDSGRSRLLKQLLVS